MLDNMEREHHKEFTNQYVEKELQKEKEYYDVILKRKL